MNYRNVKKMSRLQAVAERKVRLANTLSGQGVYIFRNSTKGELTLPKKSLDGKKVVQPNETFTGDSYFMNLLKNHDVTLVETIRTPEDERKAMAEEKLILDQPDRVTTEGTVEQVVVPEKVNPLNETTPAIATPKKDVLISEDPLAGVEILMG